jgi:large subunit ribosomal protein L24
VASIKKNDTVIAVAGVNAGKTGKVLQVMPARGRALVEGVNLIKKNLRKSEESPQGGVVEKEAPIAISNLMLYCPECKKGVRLSRLRDVGKTIRKCRLCEHQFDG